MTWKNILKNIPKCPTCGKNHKDIAFDEKVGWHWNPSDDGEKILEAKPVNMKDIDWGEEE